MSHQSRSRAAGARTLLRGVPAPAAALVAALVAGLTACGGPSGDPLASRPYDAAHQLTVGTAGRAAGRPADPDQPLVVTARDGGRITDVTASDEAGRHLRGELTADGRRWHSTTPLTADTHYTLRVSTENGRGAPGRHTLGVDTAEAGDRRLRVALGPGSGTYGVGQPLTARLSDPVADPAERALVERSLKVTSRPAVTGSWTWVDDRTLHYRPRGYWPAHATVSVRSTLRGARVRPGLFGGATPPMTLRTGDRVEAVTDAAAHRMTVLRDGRVVRVLPVTTGKSGYETRNGVKVILSREETVRMRGTTIGISESSDDSYDLLVHWAARLTWSGEYVHAAPWSVDSQGYENVSHGCTGMSTEDAHWFFETTRVGDIVRTVNSGGATMTPFDNGFGDWNVPWRLWRANSALTPHRAAPDAADGTRSARLRPGT
ncbi:Ig-like domain-containing protein [Streptomyces sp. B1866]|uniref:L,D-transpeptidase n=1 Tax=Streptomyces sp. B1866 TaxID=3075431 RepID=UPI00289203F3|nr:Ig-like domain-containing protein [Streptomyces sp. B1866]MDT3397842.1 Ig-like domain-containing protein [Streptomyces sp. B1866]